NQQFECLDIRPKKSPQTRFIARVQRPKFLTAARAEFPKRFEALFQPVEPTRQEESPELAAETRKPRAPRCLRPGVDPRADGRVIEVDRRDARKGAKLIQIFLRIPVEIVVEKNQDVLLAELVQPAL